MDAATPNRPASGMQEPALLPPMLTQSHTVCAVVGPAAASLFLQSHSLFASASHPPRVAASSAASRLHSDQSAPSRFSPSLTLAVAMSFGQLVIGPPGAGKTSYCNAMQHFLTQQGRSDTRRQNSDRGDEERQRPSEHGEHTS